MASSHGITHLVAHDPEHRPRSQKPHGHASGQEQRRSKAWAPPSKKPKASHGRDVGSTLAFMVVGGFFTLTTLMLFLRIPSEAQNIAYMLLGGLVTGFSLVLSYYFGSSAGSASKTAQLARFAGLDHRNHTTHRPKL
jgi:hypothetical protein